MRGAVASLELEQLSSCLTACNVCYQGAMQRSLRKSIWLTKFFGTPRNGKSTTRCAAQPLFRQRAILAAHMTESEPPDPQVVGRRRASKAVIALTAVQYGEDAIKEGMGSGGGPSSGMESIFEMFGGGGRSRTRERRGENVLHRLRVTLEDMYKGATRQAPAAQPNDSACNGS